MNIKILGTGCTNCRKLEALVRDVVSEMGADTQIEEVRDIQDILSYGIMSTPGLVIDGVVKSTGRIPSRAEVTNWITTSLALEAQS